jgi:hypothetical protein
MSDLRVPPAVTFKFERIVSEVCHHAKLDTDEWPLRARELLDHLQERWREGAESGLSTETAEARALERFGHPLAVARGLRQPWFKRLMYQNRLRLHRYVTFLTATMCGNLLIGFEHFLLHDLEFDAPRLVGTSVNGFLALGSLYVIKWQPAGWSPWVRSLWAIRHGLWIFVVVGFLNVAFNPILAFVALFRGHVFREVLFVIFPGPVFLGLIGAACFFSELFDFSGRRKAKMEEFLAFKVIR